LRRLRAIAVVTCVTVGCVVFGCGDDGAMQPRDAAGDGASSAGWSFGMPVGHGAIQETAAVAVAGKVYLVGGFDGDEGIVARVQVYDTAADSWSDGPALPRALHHANVASDGTTIYVLGALVGNNFAAIGDVYRYAPATDSGWQARASMPNGRERGAAVTDVIDGKIYIAGGFRNVQASDLLDVYDPVADSWTPLASMPAPRDHACGGTLSGALVAAGGRTVQTNNPRADVWSYAPGTNTWTPRAAMPTGRGGMGCGVIADRLYTTGGEGNPAVPSGVFASVESYSLATDRWTEHAPMPTPKHGVGGAVWDGALYLCGGADREAFGAIATTDIFRP
jgi:N-acetylneuraminic acid mutarotase